MLDSFGDNAIKLELEFHVLTGSADARDAARHRIMVDAVESLESADIKLSYQAALAEVD